MAIRPWQIGWLLETAAYDSGGKFACWVTGSANCEMIRMPRSAWSRREMKQQRRRDQTPIAPTASFNRPISKWPSACQMT